MEKTMMELQQVLKKNRVQIMGNLREVSTMRDGSTLVADVIRSRDGEIKHRFFKATDDKIQSGFFKKGKFHFYKNSTIKLW